MQARLLVGNGGSTGIAISASGEVTMAAQPAVYATGNGTGNETGAGASYTVIFTERFDQNADFNGTTTFTAPVTGRYQITAQTTWNPITESMTDGRFQLLISNLTQASFTNPWATYNPSQAVMTMNVSVLADMDAADTCTVVAVIANGAGNTADLQPANTFFCARLVV
jgi:hypothetical protein